MPDYKQRFRALHARVGDRVPVRAEAPTVRGNDTVAVIRLYDPIDDWGGIWGVSAKEFVDVLDELPDSVTEIQLLINSPGGVVFDGIAILNALRRHEAKVVAVVEGIAASIASDIAVGCDELVMAPNSELFIHDSWGLCVGNAQDMRQMADELDHLSDNIASVYAAKAGGSVEEWRARMQAEEWFSAEEAVAAGLADRIDDVRSPEAASDAKARFDLSVFSGRREAPGPQAPAPPGGSSTNPPEGGPAVAFADEQITDLRQKLGVADDADEATILAAVDDLLEQVTAPPPDTPKLPDGVVPIDAAQLEQLKADAAAGRDARAEQLKTHREAVVNEAVSDGRIPPARKDAWLAQLEADPGAEQVLAGLAKGTIPVNQIGVNGQGDLDSDDALYAAIYGQEAIR